MAVTYEVTLVARTPTSSGLPSLVEVDRVVVESVEYTEELNRPGSAKLNAPIRTLSSAVKERLADLAAFPCEARIYRGDALVWAGEVQTIGVDGQTVQIGCAGLLGYLYRMGVTVDFTFTGLDQLVIAKTLVDAWQGLTYGNYGIDTSGIGTSGVLRDRVYLASELNSVGKRVLELGQVVDGFDVAVDPVTRDLVLSHPGQGQDLTESVFLDERNIDDASVAMSVAPEDLVSDGSFTGSSTDGTENTTLFVQRANATLRAAYGRSWGGESFDGVSNTATLNGKGDAYLGARTGTFFQPGASLIPRVGCMPGDIHPGDVVSYAWDAGLGVQAGEFRLAKVTVTVDAGGKERIGVEFT